MSSTPALPKLTAHPTTHPDSCLSLSQPLIIILMSLPSPTNPTILSIGSGTGLLEALLNSTPITTHGIESHPGSANKYLPTQNLHLVPGTWALLPPATAAGYGMWMFVYPREAVLVRRYIACLDAMAGKEEKKVLVWAGPKSDWEDVFEGEFGVEGIVRRGLYAGVEGGVADWEVLVVSDWVG